MEKEIVGAKPEWMYRQSGVVPLIEVGGAPGVVLITSTSTGLWCFPKGVIEPGMTARDSALKEAYEEAGLRGFALEAEIGEYQYQKWSGKCTVKMFVMEVEEILDDWEDKKARKRSICPVD